MKQHEVVSAVELLKQLHQHQWVRPAGSVSLYRCSFGSCNARAVCPGCQNRLDIVSVKLAGFSVYWCPKHR
ncbi:hypothetical protein KSF_030910 [Reticulibacter mediterranei]|uniref:Uncharacterized protein n=1 Tax=Reticulibacter mediterranei TaxID=2778369 RepID=A0A8J3IIG8_9CHLR|nr:hypothetical protein [Reticulibacter mediterranei]GHO93043.1 hypothetical protein KSF_030910 [Reticulibacter mediterranei]